MTGRLRALWRGAIQSRFVRSFGVLLSGSAVAQLLPLAVSPLLTRLYTPAQFGEYALFVSGVNILSQLVCLKYDFAILTAKTDEDAAALFRLCLALSLVLALLLSLAAPFAPQISSALGAQGSGWLYLLPVGSMLTGLHSALTYYNTRVQCYRRITGANILRSAVLAASQVLLCFAHLGAFALTLGQVLSYGAACLLLWQKVAPFHRSAAGQGMRSAARDYDAFPKYTMPGALCNTAASGSVSFFLATFYSSRELGYYSLVNRVLATPLTLVSTSVGQVYAKELTDARENGDPKRVFRRVAGVLSVGAALLFLLLFPAAPALIRLVFGEQWGPSAAMLRILLPMVAVRFVVSPVSSTGIVFGRQLPTMLWQAGLLLAALLPAGIHLIHPMPLTHYLALQSLLMGLCYLILLIYCARLTAKGGQNHA
ncbi:lipopolysaccharide biosynthesis protein [Clostridiaceae bacterium NSJ-31]|uniref:Lipopolysaccharide biosynthesis protein n=1 Tax=Ligaoa zhengdingensis TaxID=2763658 RepID=A0A926DZ40_9FIRM|nr:lipopolysaccharide biosynthesis protein [Ligaoa zhengdingensis]MBC8546746.1 lipopolysaccharide biosynthesis protein [Ligaoa zhengdingensis]